MNRYILSLLFLLPIYSFAQAIDIETLKNLGDINDLNKSFINSQDESYINPTQNQYSNVVRQLDRVSEDELIAQLKNELRNEQIELATKLCERDENACYLLENYTSYQAKKNPLSLEDLEVFGIDYFSGYPLSFNQSESRGFNPEYKLRIGDSLKFNIYGVTSYNGSLSINSDGSVNIPKHGSIRIADLNILEAQQKIETYFKSNFFGSEVNFSIEQTTTIQVYVLGDVRNPGSYNISSISEPLNGIIAAGGFTSSSSLRMIEVYRDGKKYAQIDLYKFIMYGESQYLNLMNGDSIIVRSRGSSASVYGEVARPAIYELLGNEKLSDLINFAMGFTPQANKKNISISRYDEDKQISSVNSPKNLDDPINNLDIIRVPGLKSSTSNYIEITGHIKGAGVYPYSQEMRLGDLISVNDFLDDTYTGIFVIKRFQPSSNTFIYRSFDPLSESIALEKLQDKDQLIFFSFDDVYFLTSIVNLFRASSTPKVNNPLNYTNFDVNSQISFDDVEKAQNNNINYGDFINNNSELSCINSIINLSSHSFYKTLRIKSELISSKYHNIKDYDENSCPSTFSDDPNLIPILINTSVPVFGAVVNSGIYPITDSVNAARVLNFANGITGEDLESIKIDIGFNQSDSMNIFDINQLSNLQNIKYINAFELQDQSSKQFIELIGEFKYPGVYYISSNTTLSDVYSKAGGLTDLAYPAGGIFIRESIRSRETAALEKSKAELSDIFASAVASGKLQQSATDTVALINMINKLSTNAAIGRLVLELDPYLVTSNPKNDIFLEAGDKLFMPKRSNTVTIVGSVLNPITVPFSPSSSIGDYVKLAGGYKDYADASKVFAILPNGASITLDRSFFSKGTSLMPGSTIIVPRKALPLDGLLLFEKITPILANLSITMASIASVSNNN